jgi:hypothetical protein
MHFVSFFILTIRTLAKIHICFVGRRIRSETFDPLTPFSIFDAKSREVRDEADKERLDVRRGLPRHQQLYEDKIQLRKIMILG